ncbi:MAG: STAS domain-containing protein [Campylobacterota bacterium]|nr:STAS domain-containing protein [Campylobacterota bacterium]
MVTKAEQELKKTRLILDAQPNIVIVTNGKKLVDANQAFLDFFQIDSLEEFLKKADCICDYFINDENNRYLKKIYEDGTTWAELLLAEPDMSHKAFIQNRDGENIIFEVSANRLVDKDIDHKEEVVVFTDITTMEHQAQLISQMELPILDINDDVTLIPLIGMLDSVKSQRLMENILYSIKERTTKTLIIDIGGILIVDSAVAAHIIKITKATKLMGCTTILSGIAPEVAQTIVNLGINLDGISTTSTLQDALKTIDIK